MKAAYLLIALTATSATAADPIRDSVVKILVNQRQPDFLRPWTKQPTRTISGSGAVIAGQRILTNAHVVAYASVIYVQPHQSSARIRAKVVAFAPEMDLAMLTLNDPQFFATRKPLPLAKRLPQVKDTINVYGFPVGGRQMSVTEGIISRIEFTPYLYNTSGLRIQVDAALNPGNSGGPAIAGNEIIGIATSRGRNTDNIGYLIPTEEIRMFLDDVKDGKYDGKPKLFGRLQTVENEALRARLNLPSETGGLMVKEPINADKGYPLKKWDVITHVAGHPLDRRGSVRVKDDLKLSFRYLIPKHVKDGKIRLTILRDGKSQETDVPVPVESNRVIPFLRGSYPRYFIVGPMTCMAATQDLIAALGSTGQFALKTKGNPMINRQHERRKFAGEELVVLGPRLFSHPVSQGYDPQVFGVIESVNQVKIKNLAHLVETIRDAKGEFLTLDIAGSYETLVFRRQELLDSTEQILDDESIRKPYSAEFGPIWEKKAD